MYVNCRLPAFKSLFNPRGWNEFKSLKDIYLEPNPHLYFNLASFIGAPPAKQYMNTKVTPESFSK